MASTSHNLQQPPNIDSGDDLSDENDNVSDVSGAEAEVESSDDNDADEDDIVYDPTWSTHTQGLRTIPFLRENKLLVDKPGDNMPIDYFLLIFDDEPALEKIVAETNKYAFEVFCGPSLSPKSRINLWKPLTIPEFKTFLGIMFHMGTIRVNRINDYWKTSYLFDMPLFRNQMTRDRFLLILRCLHFSDNNAVTDDRLFKIRLITEWFNNEMLRVYYPGKDLSLDEGMILWRGRLLFRQYIKGKRHKYGIKLYSLCEPDGLILAFAVYSGQGSPMSGKGHAAKVVRQLMCGKWDVGHSLYMDNFYNSFPLASELLRRDTYCTGTMRIDRKHLPLDVKTAKLQKGELIGRYSEGVMIGKWRDKRQVLYISTEFENDMGESINKRNQIRQKPVPIIHYNAKMKGVDRSDQLMSYYPCDHKSLRWYKKVFVHVMQMMLVNSFKLYNFANPDNRLSLYDFRLSVIASLLPPPLDPAAKRPRRCNTEHVLSRMDAKNKKTSSGRKRCRVCYREGRNKKTFYICAQCPGKPALCPVGCYEKYHA